MAKPQATDETQARVERDRAARIAALWATPLLVDTEIAEVLRLPQASWEILKSSGEGPKLFNIGRRLYALTSNVRAWLDAKSAKGDTRAWIEAKAKARAGRSR